MDPGTVFRPNLDCPARGRTGAGNSRIHSRKERRYICRECGKTFTETKGMAFYRLRTAKDLVTLVVILLAHGCPLQAIVVAFGLDERTVSSWQQRAAKQCQAVHEQLVEQPRQLGQVQADDGVKRQGGIVWMAMAIMVSTRLWLAGVVSRYRDLPLITASIEKIRPCALFGTAILFCTDGLHSSAICRVFRQRLRTGKPGRPGLRLWDQIFIAQVVKQYAKGRVVSVARRCIKGTAEQIEALLQKSQGRGVINTAFIERLNATFRARLACLVRRTRALARQIQTLHQGMYLIGSIYNFCTYHESLTVAIGPHQWLFRTPAMAACFTDHRWTVLERTS